MKKLLLIYSIFVPFVLLVLLSDRVSAQNSNVLNINVIVSDSTGKALKDVAIYNSKQNLIGITNNFGKTIVSARYGDVIVFSHISYEQIRLMISDGNIFDKKDNECGMLVVMNEKTNILPEAEIVENVPHLAYSNKQVWVSDYIVNNSGMYLIIDSNSEHSLIFLSHEQDTLAKAKINKKFDYLYEDAFGNIHLLSKDTVYQTYYDGEKLNMLYPADIQTFKQKLMPVQVITDSLLVLQRYASMWQEILYISVNRNNKETKVLADCYGSTREWGRTYYRDMKKDGIIDAIQNENPMFPDIMEMLGIEKENTFGDDAIENTFVDFESSQRARYRLQPIFSPITFFNDTIYVFDLEKDKLIKFTENGTFVKDIDISFHRTTYRKDSRIGNTWDRNIIVDKALGKCYAQFSKDGHVTLKEIDLQTGTTKNTIELNHHVFPENIQIHNGIVYYKFIDVRQTVGRDCRSLYKMQLK
ncbi:MAG: hypothetical protein IJK92_07135 [Bacteroidales bacterium]|nr:hypothetical protein [Bacteroidales bacterium]